MRLRNPLFWSVVFISLFAGSASAQAPSPLELVRGLREDGQVDLAMEYLKELEKKLLSANDKAALLLERSKCLFAASEEEPDEAARLGMVAQAREGLKTFVAQNPKHPRVVEALLTEAKLAARDAQEQLSRARQIDIPNFSDDPAEKAEREAALDKQKKEAAGARDPFLQASKRFNAASEQILARLKDETDPAIRKALEREKFDAQLASGINKLNTAETYFSPSSKEKIERNGYLEEAKKIFDELAEGPTSSRTVWIAKAWSAEVFYAQDKFKEAAEEVNKILRIEGTASQDGRRLAEFFKVRRSFDGMLRGNLKQKNDGLRDIREWLRKYDRPRSKPTPETYAVHFYEANVLQSIAESSLYDEKTRKRKVDGSGNLIAPEGVNRKNLEEAEKLYRRLTHSDNEYTERATRQRTLVVRYLMGEADLPATAYDTFEKAQMASLIQMGKLSKAENFSGSVLGFLDLRAMEVKHRQQKTVAMLERARELAAQAESPADVTDINLRLIYFYRLIGQPYQAAILGEHVARTAKGTSGKAALAGLFSLNSYLDTSKLIKDNAPDRAADRDRAVAVAKFLDEKFPNDTVTDTARHQLASLYFEEKKYSEAFDVLMKVRPAYAKINDVRLLEGFIATQLTTVRESPLPDAKKPAIFQRAIADLLKVTKPAADAPEADVRAYVSARCRVASLLLGQERADPAAEKTKPGYIQALTHAEAVLKDIPTFKIAADKGKLTLDGLEMTMIARDILTRATFLRARALLDAAEKLPTAEEKQQKLDDIVKLLQPTIDLVDKDGVLFNAEMKSWAEGTGGGGDAVQKSRIAQLAGGIDKLRIDVILTAFRVRVKQGKAAESDAMLNLMVKAGGSIENSLPLLEPVGRELAVQIVLLRKQEKKAEADALAAALGGLLEKIAKVPNLPVPTILFTGQMLLEVNKPDQAIEMLKKISAPDFNVLYKWDKDEKKWKDKTTDEIPQEIFGKTQTDLRNYASAQYGIARALREAKKFKEAEDLLKPIIEGDEKTPAWGAGRLYLRKELAMVYEGKGASITVPKEANVEWGKAVGEWKVVQGYQKSRLTKIAPLPPTATPDQKTAFQQQLADARNDYADAFFDVNRCYVKANQQLLRGLPPEKIQKTYDSIGKLFAQFEAQIPAAEWQPEVQHRFADFLKEVPELVGPYKAAGGKLFLERMPGKK